MHIFNMNAKLAISSVHLSCHNRKKSPVSGLISTSFFTDNRKGSNCFLLRFGNQVWAIPTTPLFWDTEAILPWFSAFQVVSVGFNCLHFTVIVPHVTARSSFRWKTHKDKRNLIWLGAGCWCWACCFVSSACLNFNLTPKMCSSGSRTNRPLGRNITISSESLASMIFCWRPGMVVR